MHGSIVGSGATAEAKAFALTSRAPADARHYAVEAARRLGAGHLADEAGLIVTELAANAVLHAQSGFSVELSSHPGILCILVSDGNGLISGERLVPTPMHGLSVVAALASEWGVTSSADEGKTVWVNLKTGR